MNQVQYLGGDGRWNSFLSELLSKQSKPGIIVHEFDGFCPSAVSQYPKR